MTLELLLSSLALAISLTPDAQLRLEVREALPDELDIQNARHTFLVLAE